MKSKQFSAMILAAGFGKRLNPITNEVPKPLVKIAGKTLLKNTIDFLFNLNCEEIIINTHYKHETINNFIKKKYAKKKIYISYERKLLDTGGGVKKALPLFTNNKVLILNSDVYWKLNNFKEIINFVNSYKNEQKCKLLLVSKLNAYGMYKDEGDFIINDGLINRYKQNDNIYFYTGAQLISLDILNEFKDEKFSFNIVWDQLISKRLIFGDIMKSNWYHVGDRKGLKEAENLMALI